MSDVMLRILGFDRMDQFRTVAEFERHLCLLLASGAYIFGDDDQPVLCFGRQLVDRVHGLRIEIFPREHAPPHFHITGGDIDASFAISDCSLLAGRIGRKEEELVRFWYAHAKAKLVAVWNATRPANCAVGPIVAL